MNVACPRRKRRSDAGGRFVFHPRGIGIATSDLSRCRDPDDRRGPDDALGRTVTAGIGGARTRPSPRADGDLARREARVHGGGSDATAWSRRQVAHSRRRRPQRAGARPAGRGTRRFSSDPRRLSLTPVRDTARILADVRSRAALAAKPDVKYHQGRLTMPRVVVFGSSNTDMTVRVPRLPVPGQTILGSTFSTTSRRQGGQPGRRGPPGRRRGRLCDGRGQRRSGQAGRWKFTNARGSTSATFRLSTVVASGVALIFVDDDGENMIGVALGRQSSAHAGRRRSFAGVALSRQATCCWPAWRSPSRPRSVLCGAVSRRGCSRS